MTSLDLRDFFEAFDRNDPYMLAAVSKLHCEDARLAPEILEKESEWYETWTIGGKRDLRTGLLL
tara:strand:+ start:731 stop:922 length:192 start_codon:yes stop_codon:yes gene_type:complete